MAWKLAPAIQELREETNALFPGRSKASDGTIGDTAHASRLSDHNPDQDDYVTAIDLTHDPEHGFDIEVQSERLRILCNAGKLPQLKYIIANGRIYNPDISPAWRPYNGSNAHRKHMHVSCKQAYKLSRMRWWPEATTGEDEEEMTPQQLAEIKSHIDKAVNLTTFDIKTWADNKINTESSVIQGEITKARVELAAARDALTAEIRNIVCECGDVTVPEATAIARAVVEAFGNKLLQQG